MGKNWQWSYEHGRKKRLYAELTAYKTSQPLDSSNIPLHSHDGTYQSQFNKGWQSINSVEISMYIEDQTHLSSNLNEASGRNSYEAVRGRLAMYFKGVENGHSRPCAKNS